jgi:hypothetical protein
MNPMARQRGRNPTDDNITRISRLQNLMLLEPVGFARMTCYCDWDHREPMQRPSPRLILALEESAHGLNQPRDDPIGHP